MSFLSSFPQSSEILCLSPNSLAFSLPRILKPLHSLLLLPKEVEGERDEVKRLKIIPEGPEVVVVPAKTRLMPLGGLCMFSTYLAYNGFGSVLQPFLTPILRHMASDLNLNIRNDGYVMVEDLLKLNMITFADIPLRSHTIEDVKEAVRKDNKQRFSLLEEDGRLLIRANQGHSVTTVKTESLLKPILSAEEFPVCVHGTYKRNLKSILDSGLKKMQRLQVLFACGLPTDNDVVSGMRRDINMLIFLLMSEKLWKGMKLYISDNKVILTEGFDGIVPVKYFEKIVLWPDRQPIPFENMEDSTIKSTET